MKPSVLKRFITWIGPHDYNYSLIFAWIFIFMWAQARQFITTARSNWEKVLFALEISLVITSIVSIIILYLFICMRLRKKNFTTLRRYSLEIMGAALLSALLTNLYNSTIIPWSGRPQYLGPNDKPIIIIVRVIFSFIFVAATHNLQRNLKARLAEAENKNFTLQNRYKVLIDSDEEIRGQASRYLHDRVQSEIMLASSKLKGRISEIGFAQDEQLAQSIHNLERIRSIDLKLVSQILTPNIEADGIGGAIENLCGQYRSNFSYKLEIDSEVEAIERQQLLGLFRIVEQGVINAITHGPAENISIKILGDHLKGFTLEVSDDGPGSNSQESGTGTVIIDAWVSILNGKKELNSQIGKGYRLLVSFPGR